MDVERVAPCLPGAEITEVGDDGTYRGTFSVRLGPTTAAYRGELQMEELDEARAPGRDAGERPGQARPGVGEGVDREHHARRGRRDARGRGDRLHDHRPAGALRARRDDPGHLEPAAEGLRRLPPAEDRGAARGRAERARRRGRRDPEGAAVAPPRRAAARRRPPPSRSAASRSSSAPYSTGCADCSAAADASVSPQPSGQLAQELRVDRVRHRRLAVGHDGAGLDEPVARVAAELDRDDRVVRAVADRHREARRPWPRSSSKPSTSGMKPLSAMIPAGRGRRGAEPERVRHHRSLREPAEHRPLVRDAVLGQQVVEPAGELRIGRVEGLGVGVADAPHDVPVRAARAAATAVRARSRRAAAARDRAGRAAGRGRARRRRGREGARARPRGRRRRGGAGILIASATTLQQCSWTKRSWPPGEGCSARTPSS